MSRAAEVWPIVERMASNAATDAIDLLVYPEVAYPSYWFESAERYRQDDIERTAAVLTRFSRLAANHRIWIVAGYVEESGDDLYNSAAVFDRSGNLIGSARKQFMWDCDRIWFTPGEQSSVFETEWGPMGVLICADMRMPEISATLAARGAGFIVQPTAWVNARAFQGTHRNIQPDFLVRSRAMEFGLPFACCSKSGRDGDVMEYVGQSRIVSAAGALLGSAAIGGDELVAAELTPGESPPIGHAPALNARLLSEAPPFESDTAPPACRLLLRRGASHLLDDLRRMGARVESMALSDLSRFGPARALALDGVQVIVAAGPLTEEVHARARAAENRIYLIVADEESASLVIEPTGLIVWRRLDRLDTLDLDLAQADRKMFTPTTEIWGQRRPSSYQFK